MSASQPVEDLIPVRQHRWEDRDGDLVTVLVPKFTSRFARRWFVPLLAKPDMRVRLDATGSFVWLQCDGRRTVREIAARAAERSGGDSAATLVSVVHFVRKLAREQSLSFTRPGESA